MRTNELHLTDDSGSTVIKSYHSLLSPQKREYQAHHHTECELSVFLRGSGIYKLESREYSFHPGSIFLFASNEAHCITEIFEEMDLLNFHFEPRILWEHPECSHILNLFTARSEHFQNCFPSGDFVLSSKLQELESELLEQKLGCLINSKYLLFSVLVHLIRNYDCVDPCKNLNPINLPLNNLKHAIQYINDHLGDPLTLTQLADIAHLTPTYFSSLFKRFNGVSPWKYITIKRVEMAVSLLRSTSMTKLEIAEKCGFSSSSNFYSAFSAITGKTPSAFTASKE